ncbi:hypothetical protein HNP77_000754 [Treponema rectale]|uniref:Rpn family recombination-promoting nuclease/putative transposase n=1 Tax=Treponema rectale TaxID=744512 RepID=A0A840SCG1_9SPIR|nr:hypothetical protein [Treponema rectale]MBB5218410.1 hypothetical protein [Treponema rectale]
MMDSKNTISFSESSEGSFISSGHPVQRQYKDRLFKFIFGSGTEDSMKRLLSLYNALNNSNHTDIRDISLTTIENIIYVTMKNDISFVIDDQMNLYEQQSSYNPNMPLRGFMYFAQLYQRHLALEKKDIYGTKKIMIPAPRFAVLYNGTKNTPDLVKLRLSDSFEGKTEKGDFEWTATMYNINLSHNYELQKKCKSLYDYSWYVEEVRKNKLTMTTKEAVNAAVDSAIKKNLLDGLFLEQKMEILNMTLTEFDQEEYDRNRREEGREEGRIEGLKAGEIKGKNEKARETARNLLLMKVLTPEQIAQGCGLTVEEVLEIEKGIK